jgi:hypothetical protein
MPAVAESLRRAYPALPERAGVGSILANPDAQNVPSFRRWRFEMKLSPFCFASVRFCLPALKSPTPKNSNDAHRRKVNWLTWECSYVHNTMSDSSHTPEYIFEGDYRYSPMTKKLLEQFFHKKQIKNKTIDPNGKVSVRGIFYLMLMSTCPDDGDVNWSMSAICDQKDIDRADVYKPMKSELAIEKFLINLSRPFSKVKRK